jgi:hypothetical protein
MAKRKRSTFERLQRGEKLSWRERRQLDRQFGAEDPGWEIVHQNVAGSMSGMKVILSQWMQSWQITRCGNSVPGRPRCRRWWPGCRRVRSSGW